MHLAREFYPPPPRAPSHPVPLLPFLCSSRPCFHSRLCGPPPLLVIPLITTGEGSSEGAELPSPGSPLRRLLLLVVACFPSLSDLGPDWLLLPRLDPIYFVGCEFAPCFIDTNPRWPPLTVSPQY